MADALSHARQLAHAVRFSEDRPLAGHEETYPPTEYVRGIFRQTGLRISEEVTPGLWHGLSVVCRCLKIPPETVEAFVYASPELQAECYSGGDNTCVIRFTSGIVELLSDDEFAFVVGHELGHFLLGHGAGGSRGEAQSIGQFVQQRCMEISSDRIGLLGCRSLDASVRAMMKIASGLGRRHLRFDVGRFVSQLWEGHEAKTSFNETGTHPSLLVRARAMLWFSMSGVLEAGIEGIDKGSLEHLDCRVSQDLHRYVDGPARQRIVDAKDDVLLWLVACRMAQASPLEADARVSLAKMLGPETLEKLQAYIASLPPRTMTETLDRKLHEAESQLRALMPVSFAADRREILRRLDGLLGPEAASEGDV